MAFHRIPGSSKSLGPYGFVYSGNRTRTGREVMSLKHFTGSRRRSKTARSRANPRRSRASRASRGIPREEGQGSPRGWVSRGKRRGY